MAVEYTERRSSPRYPCDTGVLINGGFWGTLSDVSIDGCYIYTFSPLGVGQDAVLEIKANGKEIKVAGKTVSSHPGVGMGVAFSQFTNADDEQILKRYIAHLASQPKAKEGLEVH